MSCSTLARFLVIATLGLASSVGATEFYGLDNPNAALLRMDTSTNLATPLGTITGGPNSGFGAMTAGPQGTLYALVPGLINGYTVYAIDTTTLQATALHGPIGATTGGVGLCYDEQRNSLWVAGYVQRSLNIRLEEVNLTSGVATSIGLLSGNLWGLALDAQGNLYTTMQSGASADLLRISKTNAQASIVGSLGVIDVSSGLDIATDRGSGSMHVLERSLDSIYRVNQTTGAATLVSMVGGSANVRFFDEIPCPALSNYGSGCPGSGGFAPRLQVIGCPARGAAISVELSQAVGGSFAVVLFGTSRIVIPIGGGCDLLVTPILPVQVSLSLGGVGAGNGTASFPANIPRFLPAGTLTMQAFCLDLQLATQLTTSNGVEITI